MRFRGNLMLFISEVLALLYVLQGIELLGVYSIPVSHGLKNLKIGKQM